MPRRNRSNTNDKPQHTGRARRTSGRGRSSNGHKVADLGVIRDPVIDNT